MRIIAPFLTAAAVALAVPALAQTAPAPTAPAAPLSAAPTAEAPRAQHLGPLVTPADLAANANLTADAYERAEADPDEGHPQRSR